MLPLRQISLLIINIVTFKTFTKMSKKVEKKIDELLTWLAINNESVVVIYKDEKDNVHYFDSCKDGLDIAAAIVTVLDDYYGDDIKDGKIFAEGVMDALGAIIKKHGNAGRRIVLRLMPMISMAAKKTLENLRDRLQEMAGDNDEDADEDCTDCDERFNCPLPSAIKWRKENHVPAPSNRHGKNGRKHTNK